MLPLTCKGLAGMVRNVYNNIPVKPFEAWFQWDRNLCILTIIQLIFENKEFHGYLLIKPQEILLLKLYGQPVQLLILENLSTTN